MKYFRLIFVIILLLYGKTALAGLIINEIMYDLPGTDTNREWVEIYNDGEISVDLTSYKFFEANTNHAITSVQGGQSIATGDYAVIVANPDKFLEDWPNNSFQIFDSTFSLANEAGETLGIKDSSGGTLDSISYGSVDGAIGDGNTLNRNGNSWEVGAPTPGQANGGEIIDEENETTVETTSAKTEETIIPVLSPEMKVEIIAPTKAVTMVPVAFTSDARGYTGELLNVGYFIWNFGDGTLFAEDVRSEELLHTYTNPGDYVVTLSYYKFPRDGKPDAVDRMTINITSAGVIISGIANDGSIELTNKSKTEIDISFFKLSSGIYSFTIPNGTYILAGKKIYIGANATKFPKLSYVTLNYADGTKVMDYPEIVLAKKTNDRSKVVITPKEETVSIVVEEKPIPKVLGAEISDVEEIPMIEKEGIKEKGNSQSMIAYTSMGVLLLIGATATIMIRKSRNNLLRDPLDEFEFLE